MTDSAVRRPLTDYEQALLTELRAVVAERAVATGPAGATRPTVAVRLPAALPRRRTLGLAAGALVAVAGTATASIALNRTPPAANAAYSVERAPNGSVTLTVKDVRNVAGLFEATSWVGVPTQVVPLTADCPEPPGFTGWDPFAVSITALSTTDPSFRVSASGPLPAGWVVSLGVRDGGGVPLLAEVTPDSVTCLPLPPGVAPGPTPSPTPVQPPPSPAPGQAGSGG